MVTTAYDSVTEYLAAQPARSRPVLNRVRTIIRKAVPRAVEGIAYQIPAYKVDGCAVVYFAGWKKHYSLYPVGAGIRTALGDELDAYEVEKGTIRFPLEGRVPVHLISRIVKLRAKEAKAEAEKAAARKAGKTTAKAKKARAGRRGR